MTLLEEFDSIMQSSGARKIGDWFYGLWEGFPFSAVVNIAKEPGAVTVQFRLASTIKKKLFKVIIKAMPKGIQLVEEPGACYQLLCGGRQLKQAGISLPALLNLLIHSLRDAGVAPPDECPLCHGTGCDAYAELGGYAPVHRRCVEEMMEREEKKARNSIHSGSYLTGFIGALLGGLVACIPTIIIYFLGFLAGYLYMLIPVGAYCGYHLFRGKMNRSAFICTCTVSVIHLFSMEQIIFYIEVALERHTWPGILDTIALYWSVMTAADLIGRMFLPALFMILGLCGSWELIRRNSYTDLASIVTIRSTLMDR